MSTNINATASSTDNLSKPSNIPAPPPQGLRKNGKSWHPPKSAFRPTGKQTSYTSRMSLLKSSVATKCLERQLKEEKAAGRDRRVQAIKDRRKAKEEKERLERLGEKMHWKRVERRRRREKRNKILGGGK